MDLALDRDIASLRATLVGLWPRAGVVRGVVGRLDTPLRAAAFAGVIRAAIVEGDDDGVSRALTDQPGLPWTVVDALAAAHEAAGQPREAAQVLERALRAVGPDPAASDLPRREALRRASVLLQDADAAGAAARLLQGARAEDLDDATLRLACDVIFAAARGGATGDAALLAARVARLTGDDRFRVRAIGMADAAGGDVALHVGRWCLAARDVRALPLLAHHCLEQSPAQGFFGAWHALRSGVQQFAPHAPPGFATIAGWRESLKRLPPAPALSPHRSALQRARLNRRPSRADAWADHAAELAFADQTAAARALARSGRSPSACSLVVRLAFDAVLAAGPARARAIADGLASVPPSLRGPIVDEFDRLSAAGATSARQRRQVDALAARARAVVDIAIDDAALGRAVDVPAVLRSLGRRPPASTRTAAAALLALLGLEPLAAAVMPTVSSPPPVTTPRTARAPGTDGEIDDVVRLGRLRLAQLGGPRLDVEEEILAIAERLGRTTIVAQSLHHLACLAPTPAERAHHLLRRAELLRQRQPERSWRSAVAAHQLNPGEQSARLLLVLADVGGIAVRREQALAAWGAHASAADDRVAAALEHARIVATDGADPARAVALLRAAARRTPRAALFRERSRLARAALNDERAAALADLEAAAEASDLDAASRLQLLRPAAAVLAAHGDAESVERAVAALCLAHEQGDATALAEAEPLARSRLGPSALARVLDLRLRDIEDDLTRRGLTLERAQLLRQLDDWSGALALLEAHAVADEQDVDARLQLGRWYLEDRRVLDAALAYESAARVAGLAVEVCGPAAREAAVLLAAVGALDRAGPLADLAVNVGFADLQVITVAEAWHRSRENWIAVDELLGRELTFVDDPRRAAHIWMERAVVRRERTTDDAGARKALARVLELVPDHPRALEMARDDARKTDTWDILRAALLRASETTTARHARAGLLREIAVIDADQLGDVRAALALVDRALDLVPEDVDAMVAKAVWMVRVGQVDGVAALMEQIELAGGDASRLPGQLHLVRGDALVVAGDVVAARIAFRRAVEDPESAAKAWDRLIDMAWGTPEALTLLADARRSTVESARHAELSRKELRLRTNLGDVDGAVAAAVTLLRHEPG
ncbi:MAG: hypothetical protein FJ137_22325, partial [Deltaproteobacteria bacterium]|nr:hypothetical protein [Deltaproteobacteria bacterium]